MSNIYLKSQPLVKSENFKVDTSNFNNFLNSSDNNLQDVLDKLDDFNFSDTTNSNHIGIIYKNGTPFIHNFNYGDNGTVTTEGHNLFVGKNAGNFTMGSTATQTYHASYNTFVGEYAGYYNTTGHNNTFLGMYAGYSNTTGYNNTFLGQGAGRYIADGSSPNQTSNSSLYLGYNTKAYADGDTNEIVIGYNATGNGSNTVTLGNDDIISTYLKGTVYVNNIISSPVNDIGSPGTLGFGVGICDVNNLPPGFTPLDGTYFIGSDNYGNYMYKEGSIMVYLPRCYYKIGTGSNGLDVNVIDIKSIYDYPDTKVQIKLMSQASACVVTTFRNHGLSNGDYVFLSHIEQNEWKDLSGYYYIAQNVTSTTFELRKPDGTTTIDTSGYSSTYDLESNLNAKIVYNGAMADGYLWFRADIDDGKVLAGQFVDKYMSSKNAWGSGYVASSLRNGLPISTNAAHNPIADLTACAGNYYYEAINAAHARDGEDGNIDSASMFFTDSRFVQFKRAALHMAHGQASTSTTYCAWYDSTYNFPKGCNNNALGDINDPEVAYESDGYSNCGKTGSGTPFAKTTHNGQNCGVADLNGLMWEVNLGLTCIATTADIEEITSATIPVFKWTSHGLSVGDYVQITNIAQADWANLKNRIWKVATVVDADHFTLETAPDTSGYAAYDASTDGGIFTKGTFYVAKPSIAMKDFTSGNSSATDHWGATGVAAMMEEFVPNFRTDYPNNGFGQRYGNGTNQVLSETDWILTGLGIPNPNAVSGGGTNLFGQDYYYQYIRNELCFLSCARWYGGASAGVWAASWSNSRTASHTNVGFRSACAVVEV